MHLVLRVETDWLPQLLLTVSDRNLHLTQKQQQHNSDNLYMRLLTSSPSTHMQYNLLSPQALLLPDCFHRYLATQHKGHGLPCHEHRPKDQLL